MKILDLLKSALSFLLIAAFLILISPVIIIGIAVFGGLHLLELLFRKIRRDPTTKLKTLVPVSEDVDDEYDIAPARTYFNDLVTVIGEKADCKVGETIETTEPSALQTDDLTITLQKTLHAKNAKAIFSLRIEKSKTKKGDDNIYYSVIDSEDCQLAGDITVQLELKDFECKNVELHIDYLQEAAYLCMGLLQGNAKCNPKTQQLWTHIEDEDVWLVRYKSSNGTDYGLRKQYGEGRARLLWFDGKD